MPARGRESPGWLTTDGAGIDSLASLCIEPSDISEAGPLGSRCNLPAACWSPEGASPIRARVCGAIGTLSVAKPPISARL